MDSQDILETINWVSISTSNLRFCFALDALSLDYRFIRADLESIRLDISHHLYAVLDTELRLVHLEQLRKIKGCQA